VIQVKITVGKTYVMMSRITQATTPLAVYKEQTL